MATVDLRKNILILMELMLTETDEEHMLSTNQIMEKLSFRDASMGKKQLRSGMEILIDYGIDIVVVSRKSGNLYFVRKRPFESDELFLLASGVIASKHITSGKTAELLGKLGKLTSRHQATTLRSQIFQAGRIKSPDDSILRNSGVIHKAIRNNRQIDFYYNQWNLKKEMKRKKGYKYVVSPMAMTYTEGWYYLVGYSHEHKSLRHYRVDKMELLRQKQEYREAADHYSETSFVEYFNRVFHMYGSEKIEHVAFAFKEDGIGILIDRFGYEFPVMPYKDGYYKTIIAVATSPQFYGWLVGLDNKIRMIGAGRAFMGYREYIDKHHEELHNDTFYEVNKKKTLKEGESK